jgi:hypothetical protein
LSCAAAAPVISTSAPSAASMFRIDLPIEVLPGDIFRRYFRAT